MLLTRLRQEHELEASLSYTASPRLKNNDAGAREIAQSVECLPHRREGLSSDPRTEVKLRGTSVMCYPCTGEVDTGRCLELAARPA